jgi:hypothetical protein
VIRLRAPAHRGLLEIGRSATVIIDHFTEIGTRLNAMSISMLRSSWTVCY